MGDHVRRSSYLFSAGKRTMFARSYLCSVETRFRDRKRVTVALTQFVKCRRRRLENVVASEGSYSIRAAAR